jgi:anthranilate phosphoribosyltransferase
MTTESSFHKNKALKEVAPLLEKLARGKDLSASEARRALNVIGDNDEITDRENSDGLYALALIFGLMAKGPTADELRGLVESISDHSVFFDVPDLRDKLIDISGTGGDRIKTLNVGSIASFVMAAGGLFVGKQATRGYTGFTGSASAFQEIGLDPFTFPQEKVVETLKDIGLVAVYTPAYSRGFKNRIDFLTKLRTIGLLFPTPWHLISWVYSPFPLKYRIYGVFQESYVKTIAELFQKLGYERVLVVHGVDGLDELSNVGTTVMAELRDGQIFESKIEPEEVGLTRARIEDIQTLTPDEASRYYDKDISAKEREELNRIGAERNQEQFFKVIYGLDRGAKRDLVALNAGAGFMITGTVSDLKEGVKKALAIMESGEPAKRLERLAERAGNKEKLKEWKSRIGIG